MGDTWPVDTPLLELARAGLGPLAGVDVTKLPGGGFDAAWFHPEAEFDLGQMALPDEKVWRGPQGIIDGWQRWLGQWDDYRFTASNLEQRGDDCIVADIHAEARGRGSGAPISIDHVQTWTVRGARFFRINVYRDREEALEAVSRSAPAAAGGPRTPPAP